MEIARTTIEVLCMLGIVFTLYIAKWNLFRLWSLGPRGFWQSNLPFVLFCPARFNEQQQPYRKRVVQASVGLLACCLLAIAIGAGANR
jgi:hypothetical protein